MVGGLAYFLAGFLSTTTSVSAGVILEALGLFICSSCAACVIMTPKLLVIEGFKVVPAGALSSDSAVSGFVSRIGARSSGGSEDYGNSPRNTKTIKSGKLYESNVSRLVVKPSANLDAVLEYGEDASIHV